MVNVIDLCRITNWTTFGCAPVIVSHALECDGSSGNRSIYLRNSCPTKSHFILAERGPQVARLPLQWLGVKADRQR